MSFTLHGLAVSGGIAIGRAQLVSHATLEVAHYVVQDERVEAEVARFDAAVRSVRAELEALRFATSGAPAEFSAFVDLHAMILADPELSEAPRDIIRERRCNAEWALVQRMDHLVAQFEEIEDEYLRERKADIVQVVERLVKELTGRADHLASQLAACMGGAENCEDGLIIVAHDLSPADVIRFKQHRFAGFVTDVGGATSHTAILARSMGIPAVVGLHHARALVRDEEMLILDGTRGVLIASPDPAVLEEYRLRQRELEAARGLLRRLVHAPSATRDGTAVSLQANIELPQDVDSVRESGAAGIGLFRSEFLFLNRGDMPNEEEQFEAYRSVAAAMGELPVTIRTLDLGADKALPGTERSQANPALGLRAIRLCLAEPQMFLTQLRAILRASHYGRVKILLPMLAHAHEIAQSLALIAQAKAELATAHIPFDEHIAVGGMIEIPAAALALRPFLRRLDFLSIGTNDLIQYTLAIDRTDEDVAHLYEPLHPAVLHLVAHTLAAGARAGKPVAVCGEMAGDPGLTRLLLGLGLRQFSMHPSQLLEVKQRVINADIGEISRLSRRLLRVDDMEKAHELLERINAA